MQKKTPHNEISCVREWFFTIHKIWQNYVNFIFWISKFLYIGFKNLLHQLHQLHQTQLRHRNLRRQLSILFFWTAPELHLNCTYCTKLNWDTEIFDVSWVFCFFLNCTNCTKLNWDTEIFDVRWNCTWTAPKKKTKIVKFFQHQWIFFVFIFNYELDIFYPFSKMTKSHF